MRATLCLSTLFGLVLFTSACFDDGASSLDELSEQGRWRVGKAFRNGRPTTTFDAAYFEFDTARHELTTNFTGQESNITYERSNTRIEVSNAPLGIQGFDLSRPNDSTLIVSTELQNHAFKFELIRE